LPPDATLAEAETLMSRYRISGVPITDKRGVLVGILTNRDVRFTDEYRRPVSEFMTSDRLVTARLGTTLEDAKVILQEHRIEKLPLVDERGCLKGLITVKDILKKRDFPYAATDDQGRLMVAAAIGVGDAGIERLAALVEADVDAIAVDTAHGHSDMVVKTVERVRAAYPDLPLIAGNVVTAEGTRDLIAAGADAVKVGVGAGSICTTRVVAGVGMPQLSAIIACAEEAARHNIPIIADGGIKYSGDIVKALAAGAETVMLGSMLAGLDESPGDLVLFEGRRFKDYRGMGSETAMRGFGADRYGSGQGRASGKVAPEGVEGRVPYKGSLHDYMLQMLGGLRAGMGYVGSHTLADLRQRARFVRITHAGLIESHPHDVVITKEAPNYQVRAQN
jgi:IMP dehydrogenase